MHSMHTGKKEATILKIDLFKAYDTVEWSHFRLVLLKIGLPVQSIRWIMACISSVTYVVLINGFPTKFFKAQRGIRQGCALSPLIFILIMDGFSRIMRMALSSRYISRFSFSTEVCITHSIFVDDLLIFCQINRNHCFYIHYILIRFGKAFGLCINKGKSFIIFDIGDEHEIRFIAEFMGINVKRAAEGLLYLGF